MIVVAHQIDPPVVISQIQSSRDLIPFVSISVSSLVLLFPFIISLCLPVSTTVGACNILLKEFLLADVF